MTTQKTQKSKTGRPRSDTPGVAQPNAFALWIAGRGYTVEKIAEMLGVHPVTVYGWRRGNRPPGRKWLAKLEALTDGAITAGVWAGTSYWDDRPDRERQNRLTRERRAKAKKRRSTKRTR